MRAISHGTTVVLLAAAIVAGAALYPMTQVVSPAHAKGGEGKGAGDGGGKGSGDSGEKGSADAAAVGDPAGGKGKGSTASLLGALNAAKASPTAMANASPNSRVGKIATYKADLILLNNAAATFNTTPSPVNLMALNAAQTTAAQALAKAANKSITPGTVTGVDALLGVSLTSTSVTNATTLANEAALLQTKH